MSKSAATIGDRIQQVRIERRMSRPELAEASDIKYSTLAGIENSDQTSSTKLHAIAKALKVRIEWLETGKGPKEPTSANAIDEDWADIRGYAQAVGLGDGVEGDEYAEAHKFKFRRDSLARKRLNPSNLAVIYGKGDSMLPRIRSGDAILFDTKDTTASDGDLFVISMDGMANTEYNVKRCEIIDDLVFFRADNPEGDHLWRTAKRMDSKRNPITIIGRVRWIGSWEG